jgi:RNA polymerase sigma factor (sigma-70 family)
MDLVLLVEAAKAGDRAAYGQVVRRFQDMAFGSAYAWLGDAEEAQDAAQDAFVEAWESLDKLRQSAAFPGWFRRIVLKRADRLRRARRSFAGPGALELLPSALPDPLTCYEAEEAKSLVHAAIASLPAAQRLPLMLYHLDGYRQGEVAEFLELPKSTVKKRIFDARRNLEQRILSMVRETLDDARPSRDDSFARKVEFFLALNARDVQGMERLLQKDASLLEAKGDWQVAPGLRSMGMEANAVRWAAYVGHVDMLAMLLDHGADVDSPEQHGDTLLHVAVMQGRQEAVQLLLKRKAAINALGSCRHTPLHRAVMRGEAEIVRLLVEKGADVEIGDNRGRSAADWAAIKGRAEMLDWLTDQGVSKPQEPLRRPVLRKKPRPSLARLLPAGGSAMGRVLDDKGQAADGGQGLGEPTQQVSAAMDDWGEGDSNLDGWGLDGWSQVVLQTGIKAIDLMAPWRRGGHVAIDAAMGVGKSLLVEQVGRNFIEAYQGSIVYIGADQGVSLEWGSFVADGKLLGENSIHVRADKEDPASQRRAAETGLGLAEGLRREGRDVLLCVEGYVALAAGVMPFLHAQMAYCPQAAITCCYLGNIPYGIQTEKFPFLDALVRFDGGRAAAGLFPAVDLLQSFSKLLDQKLLTAEHCQIADRARACLRGYGRNNLGATVTDGQVRRVQIDHVGLADQEETERVVGRARRLAFFMTQPYHGTEIWIGEPGETVAVEDTVFGVRQILDGEHDEVPEKAFLNVGTVGQVLEKATRL